MKEYNYDKLSEYYDLLEKSEMNNEFSEVLKKILRKYKLNSVFDITCGTGAQSIYLHKEGFEIVASDISEGMLKIAEEKYNKIKWNKGDIRKINLGKFDVVISIFNAIAHLSEKDFNSAIRNISKNLKTNGVYIFDIFNYEFMEKNFISREFIDKADTENNLTFVRFNKNKLNKKDKIIKINQKIYLQEGFSKIKIFKEKWDMKIYSTKELKEILKENGFEVLEFLNVKGKKLDNKKDVSILTIARKIK